MLSLACMIAIAREPDVANTLNLGGEYLAERNIKCEVFLVYADSTTELLTTSKTHRYFNITLESNLSYLVKFTSKEGKVKYLYIPEAIPGEFIFDVDFNSDAAATLKYDDKQSRLKLERTKKKTLPVHDVK